MIRGLSSNIIYLYNLVLLVGFIWFIIQYRGKGLPLLIIFLFFGGMFSDLGGKNVFEAYKILTLIWAVFLFVRYKLLPQNELIRQMQSKNETKKIARNFGSGRRINPKEIKQYRYLIFSFSIFLIYFIITSFFLNGDNFFLVFAQLSKYTIPVLLFFVMSKVKPQRRNLLILNKLFGQLIIIQILFNVAKLLIIGHPYEGLVGSITGIAGGGAGTSFPLLGLCWLELNTNMVVTNRKSILLIIGLLFIGFMTGKRAIWFIFPILFILMSIYVCKKQYFKKMAVIILLLPLFIYAGFRLIPSLNPDDKIWGRFDPEYAWNYAVKYSTGKESDSNNIKTGVGRIGALTLVWNKITNLDSYTKNTLFGYGCEYINAADAKYYNNSNYYFGINHRGSLTGIIMLFFSIGLLGVALFLLYLIQLFTSIRYGRLKWTLFGLVCFDYIFYNGQIINQPGMQVFFLFLLIYSDIRYTKDGSYISYRLHFLSRKAVSIRSDTSFFSYLA